MVLVHVCLEQGGSEYFFIVCKFQLVIIQCQSGNLHLAIVILWAAYGIQAFLLCRWWGVKPWDDPCSSGLSSLRRCGCDCSLNAPGRNTSVHGTSSLWCWYSIFSSETRSTSLKVRDGVSLKIVSGRCWRVSSVLDVRSHLHWGGGLTLWGRNVGTIEGECTRCMPFSLV